MFMANVENFKRLWVSDLGTKRLDIGPLNWSKSTLIWTRLV